MLASLERAALSRADARPGRHHSPRAGRRRRAGPGPHRHRQDGRLRHSDPRTAQARRQRRSRPGRWSWCRRASWPCRSATNSKSWPTAGASRCVPVYGGKPIRGQIAKLQQRGRRRHRHARPRARPHRPRHARSAIDPDRRARRGRPHARHRLPARHRKNPPPLPQGAADAAPERHGRPAGRTAGPHATCATRRCWTSRPRPCRSRRSSSSTSRSTTSGSSTCWCELLKREKPEQAIVFCRTKRGTERIHRRLSKHFPGADMIHGDLAASRPATA